MSTARKLDSVTDRPNGNNQTPEKPALRAKKVLSLEEACEHVGIKKPTMYKYLKEGSIPAFKYPGSRVWKFDLEKLDQWIEEQQAKGGNQ